MEAGIAVCRQSNLLKQEVFATLPQGASRIPIPTPPDHDINRVDQVFLRDPAHPDQEWTHVNEIAPVYQERTLVHVESHAATHPTLWGLRGSTLTFSAPSDGTYPLRIIYSWAPTRASRPEVFDLPSEAEGTMVSYARWILLRDLDPKASAEAKRDFDAGLADLRGMGESGESGDRSIFDFLPYEG